MFPIVEAQGQTLTQSGFFSFLFFLSFLSINDVPRRDSWTTVAAPRAPHQPTSDVASSQHACGMTGRQACNAAVLDGGSIPAGRARGCRLYDLQSTARGAKNTGWLTATGPCLMIQLNCCLRVAHVGSNGRVLGQMARQAGQRLGGGVSRRRRGSEDDVRSELQVWRCQGVRVKSSSWLRLACGSRGRADGWPRCGAQTGLDTRKPLSLLQALTDTTRSKSRPLARHGENQQSHVKAHGQGPAPPLFGSSIHPSIP
ncbi:uncharacterized protein IWZ02DRAFT_113879 [Phyllosticta citriasiana]|uniref:uncharacterized protein n=1 Tax=Phyllosticta citriasiana TaxID=595635 RepID=UPI0030FD2C7E